MVMLFWMFRLLTIVLIVTYVSRAAKGQLEGSRIRFEEKMKKYPELVGSRFKPLVIESSGGCHPYLFDYLKCIADHISSRTNKTANDALCY
jgi:hypothetical protein